MGQGRPRLEVVPGGSGSAEAPAPAAPASGGARAGWVLGVLLLLAFVAFGVQTRRAAQLSAEAEGLRQEVSQLAGELADAQSRIEAQERHMDQVRSAVDRLQELLSREPAAPARPL